jgi:ABC-2 type transport system permease protein
VNPRRPTGPPVLCAVLCAVLGAVLTACTAGPTLDRASLQSAIGPAFQNLYALQQTELYGSDAVPPVAPDPQCGRGGSTSAGTGPGSDWNCLLQWRADDGHSETLDYGVELKPDGCYTAEGPAAQVGRQRFQGADGRSHTNPLYAFDGCLDPG